MHGTTIKPLRQGASITNVPQSEHRQRTYCVYFQPNFDIVRKVYVHNNCNCNEYIALRNRVLFDCPKPDPQYIAASKLLARLIADWLPRGNQPDPQWNSQYKGSKRVKYERAAQSLVTVPLRRSDSYVSAFVKAEKIFQLKDPRLIQARNARYNYELGCFLKPIEHQLYNLKGTGRLTKHLPPGRLIAKGCNMHRRAALIQKKMSRFQHPLVISLDASRFDAHVTDMLIVEHIIYQRYWKNPLLDKLLAWQVRNRGRTSTGIKYKCVGGRMSGDMNTALGNCLISVLMLATIMRKMHFTPKRWDMLCDGDDVLLFIDRTDRHVLTALPDQYLKFGMPIKTENITEEFHAVKFCQTSPVETLNGVTMVANPTRTLSRSLVGVKHWDNPTYVPKYLALIGYCELALNVGVPVLQEFALTILSWGSQLPRKVNTTGRVIKAIREERDHSIRPVQITPEARLSFEVAFGIPPEEQRALEGALRALSRHAAQKESKTTDTPPTKWAPAWLEKDETATSRPLYQATIHSS